MMGYSSSFEVPVHQKIKFNTAVDNPNVSGVEDVHPEEVRENKTKVALIDVRRPEEFTGELGHIPGAELIVLDTLPQAIERLPQDQTIVFVCRSGARSAQASAFAREMGFDSVYNMKGGMLFWNELGYETEV
jgi:hydroxyacylglutathione hydrolase